MGYGDEATQEAFEWVSSVREMVRAGSQVTRFLNDLSSYKVYILTVTILTSLAWFTAWYTIQFQQAYACILTAYTIIHIYMQLGKNKKDMPGSVETYMVENVLTGEEAAGTSRE